MWWVVAIIAVNAGFLPIEMFVHNADKVLHTSSWLPDFEKL
jgi:hypothetical protein